MPPEKMKQEKNLEHDADTHRDPSASETSRTDAIFQKFCPENPKPYFHDMRALAGELERNLQQCRTKLAEVERERDLLKLRFDLHDGATDQLERRVQDSHIEVVESRHQIADLRTRLTHSEVIRAELAEALDLSVATLDSITQSQSGLSTVHASIVGSAALARHRAAPSGQDAKEAQP